MTESIKAKGDALMEKFQTMIWDSGNTISKPMITQCAIIAVEEIINELPDIICGYMPEGGTAMEIDNFRKHYFKDVLIYLKSKL